MPVSGLVLTLAGEPAARDRAVATLGGDPRLTVGIACAGHLPVVAETSSEAETDALVADLAARQGVLLVRVAFHDFSDVAGPGAPGRPTPARGG